MKTILPETKITEIEIGDKFLNTTWTVSGKWWREYDNSGHLRTYVPVKCDCGEEQRGRWDRLHTTSADKAPWSTRCRKCSAGGKKRAMDTLWHNEAKSADEITQNKVNDLSGQYFGDLYVIKRLGTNKGAHSIYECQCSCGNIETITDTELKRDGKYVCSKCLNSLSNGEKFIKNILEIKKVNYSQQYVFNDLLGDDKPLRFDFALLTDQKKPYVLIEFQGKQHYEPIEYFGGQEKFEKQQRYDEKKREYCKKNHLVLLEFPYTMAPEKIKEKIECIL